MVAVDRRRVEPLASAAQGRPDQSREATGKTGQSGNEMVVERREARIRPTAKLGVASCLWQRIIGSAVNPGA